ncbi:MAG: hypothetical protein U0263_38425 [Polyangiaceae bacterium]
MLENYAKKLADEGRDERLRQIADEIAEEPTEAEGAFALAAAVALADDEVADEENELINQLAEWFGIGEERAGQILDQLEEDRKKSSGARPKRARRRRSTRARRADRPRRAAPSRSSRRRPGTSR